MKCPSCALDFLTDSIIDFLVSAHPIDAGTMIISASSTIAGAPIKTFRFSACHGMRDQNFPTTRSRRRPAAPRWQRFPHLPATVPFQTGEAQDSHLLAEVQSLGPQRQHPR